MVSGSFFFASGDDARTGPAQPPARAAGARHGLRILTPLHSFDPGGVERVALRLSGAWQAAGVDAHVVMGRGTGSAREPARGVRYEVLGGDGTDRHTQLLWMARKLPDVMRALRPDMLFCAGNTYSSVAVAMKWRLGAACPPVVAKISNDLNRADMPPALRFGYRRWLRMQGRHIDHFVAMAPAMVDEIAEALGVPTRRISVIPDPAVSHADIERLRAARAAHRPGAGRHYLGVGRLKPQKNFARLIAAFARVAGPDDRLTILGEGPEEAALRAQATALGLGARVALPGHVGDLAPWFGAADLFVLSSDYEGVPAVVIEALGAGLPIVATDCSAAMRDLLGGGALGTLVRVGDDAALAAAMAQAPATAPAPCAAAAQAARFTLEAGASAYLALMERVAAAQ